MTGILQTENGLWTPNKCQITKVPEKHCEDQINCTRATISPSL